MLTTINFELTDIESEKVIFKQYFDKNLWEYENLGSNNNIKNQYEKHKYTTLLKPLILKESLIEDYDFDYIEPMIYQKYISVSLSHVPVF